MSQRHSNYARKADEEYNTPPWVGFVIANWLKQESVRSIWEPAPGAGQLSRALVAHAFSVTETRGDFLQLPLFRPFDAIVTNPPFGKRGELAEAFIRHAVLKLNAPIAAFLLRIDYDSAKTRVDMFRDCPTFAGKIVLLDRINWFERAGKAGSSTNHAWFIWDRSGRNDGGAPWIAYGGKLDENGSRQVGDTDQGRDRDRLRRRRMASPARQGQWEAG